MLIIHPKKLCHWHARFIDIHCREKTWKERVSCYSIVVYCYAYDTLFCQRSAVTRQLWCRGYGSTTSTILCRMITLTRRFWMTRATQRRRAPPERTKRRRRRTGLKSSLVEDTPLSFGSLFELNWAQLRCSLLFFWLCIANFLGFNQNICCSDGLYACKIHWPHL